MMFFIFTSLVAAKAYRKLVDDALGLPHEGEDIGEGVHVENAMTKHYADAVKHQSQDLWAFPCDDVVAALAIPHPDASEVADLAGWFPPPSMVGLS
jgi:hypothetical protein